LRNDINKIYNISNELVMDNVDKDLYFESKVKIKDIILDEIRI
jgi:hypothetical protein